MNARKVLARLSLILLLTSLFSYSYSTLAQDEPAPQYGGTLRVADRIDLTNPDPQVSNEAPILYAFVEGLTSLGDNAELKPFLAESWEVSEDSTEYIFHLRASVRFHNGRDMTAEDVVWSLQRVQNPDTGAFRGNDLRAITVEAVDNLTVRISSPEPNAALPALLASTFILAPESVGEDGEFISPIGTGPFVFEEWIPGQEIRLTRNAEYWRDNLPYLDGVVYSIIPDPPAMLNAIRSETVDVVTGIATTDLPLIAGDSGIKTDFVTLNIIGHLTFNLRQPQSPLDDVRVRRAIGLALDKSELVTIVVGDGGPGQVNNQFWNEGDFWRLPVEDEFAQPNLDQARALLEEAGVGNGFSTTLLTWSDGRPAAEVVQARLAQLGITVQIDYAPDFPAYASRLQAYDYGMVLDSAFPREDPSAVFSFWNSANPSNYFRAGYGNAEVDDLLNAALVTSDPDTRRQNYADALEIIQSKDVASIIYLTRNAVWAMRDYVEGLTPGTGKLNRVDGGLAEVWINR